MVPAGRRGTRRHRSAILVDAACSPLILRREDRVIVRRRAVTTVPFEIAESGKGGNL